MLITGKDTVTSEIVRGYERAAAKYKPGMIEVLFIAESPPFFASETKKSYFFFEDNPGGDILFASLIEALFGVRYTKNPGLKAELLMRMRLDGYWLIDAVDYPISRDSNGRKLNNKQRKLIIQEEIPNLLRKLNDLHIKKVIAPSARIILIKGTVFDVVSPVLKAQGYDVLNNSKISFPRYHCDREVVDDVRNLLGVVSP